MRISGLINIIASGIGHPMRLLDISPARYLKTDMSGQRKILQAYLYSMYPGLDSTARGYLIDTFEALLRNGKLTLPHT